MNNKLPLVLYGAGENAADKFEDFISMNPVCFCDSDVKKHNTTYLGLPVMSLSHALEMYGDINVYITPLSAEIKNCIVVYLLENGITKEQIIVPDHWKHYKSLFSLINDNIEAHIYTLSYYRIEGWALCRHNFSEKVSVSLVDATGHSLIKINSNKFNSVLKGSKADNYNCHFFFYGCLGEVSKIVFSTFETECEINVHYAQPKNPTYSPIHPDDYLFKYYTHYISDFESAVNTYIKAGAQTAERYTNLSLEHFKEKLSSIDLLDFACGYGRVTRHFDKSIFNITASDIHADAIEFVEKQFNVNVLLSKTNPHDLIIPTKFDVILVISFFSHLPASTFGDWLTILYNALRENGILIFTVHGRISNKLHCKLNLEDGYGFRPFSEQADLVGLDYGTTVSEIPYVLKKMIYSTDTYPVFFSEGYEGHQDVYIIRKISVHSEDAI